MRILTQSVSLLFLLLGCGPENLSKSSLMDKIRRHDPDAVEILPDSIAEGVTCADYQKGCLRGFTVRVLNLKFVLVEFASEQMAKDQAADLHGLYLKNWFFDDIQTEPVLRKFIFKYIGGRRP